MHRGSDRLYGASVDVRRRNYPGEAHCRLLELHGSALHTLHVRSAVWIGGLRYAPQVEAPQVEGVVLWIIDYSTDAPCLLVP